MSAVTSRERKRRGKARDAARRKVQGRGPSPISLGAAASLFAMWVLALLLLHLHRTTAPTGLVTDQQAPMTVVAEIDFPAVDFGQTELARERAAQSIPPVFRVEQGGLQTALRNMNLLLDRVSTTPTNNPSSRQDLTLLLEANGVDLSAATLSELAQSVETDSLRIALDRSLTSIWQGGIRPTGSTSTLVEAQTIELRGLANTPPRKVKVAALPDPMQAAQQVAESLVSSLPALTDSTALLEKLAAAWMEPNLAFNSAASEEARTAAETAVVPVMTTVRAGTTLMTAGERLTAQHLEWLRAHQQQMQALKSVADRVNEIAGNGLLLGMALLVYTGVLLLSDRVELIRPRRILLTLMLSTGVLLITRGLLRLGELELLRPELVIALTPIALAALMAVIMVSAPFALATGLWTSFTVSMLFDNRYLVLTLGLALTMTAALAARNLHRRSRILRVGLIIGFTHALFMLAAGLLLQQPWVMVGQQAVTAIGGGLLTAFAVLLLVPVLESVFRCTTDLHLLELLDTTHPLLEKLAMEAPGTYHHSLMVANLAQAAAQEVGANSLLVRVCAYYHDIGKLTKPEFFIENNPYGENPHDELSPSMSTLIIISHVKEGVTMGARHKLPKPIIDAILTHHGTSVISYFHHRALTQARAEGLENGSLPRRDDFRYPGPKPYTLELGILMLADTAEAASRAMEKPSPSAIATLVEELFAAKLADGQLDDCPMTFEQLAAIKRVFIFNLNNIHHGRIAYPKNEDRSTQSAKRKVPEPQSTGTPDQTTVSTSSPS